jgi:phosphoserine phosphatase
MQAIVTLSRAPDLPILQALLPALMEAESCEFSSSPPRLTLAFEPSRQEVLSERLSSALRAVGERWDWRLLDRLDRADAPFHSLGTCVMTLIAPSEIGLSPELGPAIAEWDARLLALRVLSAGGQGRPLALELYLAGIDPHSHKLPAAELARRWGVDICLQQPGEKRPRRRLLVFDMDSTLIECEVIDELAARAGVGEKVAAITARAMRGELDFKSSFRERLAMLRGLPEREVAAVAAALPLMPGAQRLLRTLRAQGHRTAIVSGGFELFARRLQDRLGFDEVHANGLELIDGALSGVVQGEIIDGQRKAFLLEQLALREGYDRDDTVAVGDGANDLPMLALAGMGVAFHAKPLVRERAQHAVNYADLDALLYLLGVPDPAR